MDARQGALLLDIPEVIVTERMLLRAVKANDGPATFEAVLESVNDLEPWMPWVHPEPQLAGSIDFNANAQAKWYSREMLDFQWIDKTTGRLVGKGGFHTIDWSVPKMEIGYWVRTSMAGKGFCSEAVKALVEFAGTELGVKRLEICSDPRNLRSRNVAEKCGFTLEGILRRNMRDPRGGIRDSCMYARIAA
ncbi:MAG: GNAT family protein [Betaproteobacteria bacterium]